jgi:hypothetical protein
VQQENVLFDHLISEREHVVWYREVHCFSGFRVDDEQVASWDLDWQIGRLGVPAVARLLDASLKNGDPMLRFRNYASRAFSRSKTV